MATTSHARTACWLSKISEIEGPRWGASSVFDIQLEFDLLPVPEIPPAVFDLRQGLSHIALPDVE